VLPCIEVVPARESVLEEARRSAADSDWLLVTSARTIGYLWPHGHLPDVEVAAVGSRTAAAVTGAGGAVSLRGDSGSVDLISELITLVENATVCFPHGRRADLSRVRVLEEAARTVSTWAVYATEPIPPALNPVDAVAFGSPSAVAGWSRSRAFAGVAVGAIGEATGAALSDRGHPADVVADRPDYAELLERLSAAVKDRSKV
jgi:uroporphyrinogen-III synthase